MGVKRGAPLGVGGERRPVGLQRLQGCLRVLSQELALSAFWRRGSTAARPSPQFTSPRPRPCSSLPRTQTKVSGEGEPSTLDALGRGAAATALSHVL